MTKLTLVKKQERINIMKKDKSIQACLTRHWIQLNIIVD